MLSLHGQHPSTQRFAGAVQSGYHHPPAATQALSSYLGQKSASWVHSNGLPPLQALKQEISLANEAAEQAAAQRDVEVGKCAVLEAENKQLRLQLEKHAELLRRMESASSMYDAESEASSWPDSIPSRHSQCVFPDFHRDSGAGAKSYIWCVGMLLHDLPNSLAQDERHTDSLPSEEE